MTIPWREASSLILAAKCPRSECSNDDPNGYDYKILVTKRSGKSSYLANTYCFPGGHLDQADFDADWWSLFATHGFSRADMRKSLKFDAPRPPILTSPVILHSESKAKDFLWPELACRITAIRETFEETGVLLARHAKSIPSNQPLPVINNLSEWQKRVHIDANTFYELFRDYDLVPDVWALKEWWNWLTPATPGHKRFDTIFYVACLDSRPAVNSDGNEVSTISWLTPLDVLQEHQQAECFLAPPQVYELARLANFHHLDDLKAFSTEREIHGVERWCADVTGLSDGALLALPGDECFSNMKVDSSQLPSLEEMRRKVMNRMELRAPVFYPICTNIQLPCKHVSPISMPSTREAKDSSEEQTFSNVRISSNL